MKFIYPFLIIHFIPGQLGDLPAHVAAVFDSQAKCCQAYDAMQARKMNRIVPICVKISLERSVDKLQDAHLPQPVAC